MMPKYPFSPEILDAMPEELAELFRNLEITLLDEICSRLKIADNLNEVTIQDIRALRAHGIDLDEIKKAISTASDTGMDKLNKLLDDVVERNQAYYSELIDIAGVTAPQTLASARDIEAIRAQTQDEFTNITQSMGFLVDGGRTMLAPAKAYQWALDSAALQIQSGAINYTQAIKTAIKQLADNGVCVAYDAAGNPIKNMVQYEPKQPGKPGHKDHLDVAVRRAVMTGINQLNQKYREQAMDYLETDLVEVTAHIGARNVDGANVWDNHERWQGKIYRWNKKPKTSKGEYPDFEKTCGYGDVTGIGGANCRHSFYPFIEGIMERTYTDAQLDAMMGQNRVIMYEGIQYDGYSSTQKQRQIERTVRGLKRRQAAFKASGQDDEYQATSARIRRLNAKYKEFSEAAGLPMQKDRMAVLHT